MKKLTSTSLYGNSGTSSETSETQSVEDNRTAYSPNSAQRTGSKIPKSWRRMKEGNSDKEIDTKRPPWRSVSVSSFPKPDKNALLRAKLLDASRRLRATKVAVGVQTDNFTTTIMKDIGVGAQTDLILYKEIGILTDGVYTKRRDRTEEYVLTYSVALTTDTVDVAEAATQTLLPKVSGDAFLEAYLTNTQTYDSKLLEHCTDNERKLLQQLTKIRQARSLNEEKVGINNNNNNMEDKLFNHKLKIIPEISNPPHEQQRPSLLQPTERSWRFDDVQEGDQFKPYVIHAHKPWNSFVPLSFYKYRHLDWDLLLLAIDELVNESNRLADLLEDKLKRQKHYETLTSKLKEFVPTDLKLPSEHWLPIIEEQEKRLAELKSFKPINTEKYEKFLKEC